MQSHRHLLTRHSLSSPLLILCKQPQYRWFRSLSPAARAGGGGEEPPFAPPTSVVSPSPSTSHRENGASNAEFLSLKPSRVSAEGDMEQDLDKLMREWAQLRRTRLTASVFAFAIGFWEGRRVQLWKEKIGMLAPFEGNLATNWGTLKEATAIEQYVRLTDNRVQHQLFKSYPQGTSMPDWMGASPDGLIYSKSAYMLDNGGILEVKCPFNRGRPDIGVPWPYVPYYYMPQAQGLMEIFDRNWMDFYVWTMNGSSIYRIDRNPDLWELMLTALNDFWWGHVVPARHLLSKDADADVRRFKPGPHHALFLTIANKCKLLADKSPLLLHDRKPRLVR